MALTAHQQQKYDDILNLLYAGNRRIILQGSAGVGKTYLVDELVKNFRKNFKINPNFNNGQIFVTAPTNKALAVLKGKVSSDVMFKTIHAALKMTMSAPDRVTGYRKFIKVRGFEKRGEEFEHCKICVIDECSMINTEILDYLAEYKFPIIFIGDEKQINPVGEDISPVFHKGYPVVELTEIIRQGAGNPIIELSRDIDRLYFKTPKMIEGRGYTYSDAKASIIEALAEVNGTDEMKYLAFTNAEIDAVNLAVRNKRYGVPAKVEKEETLVFNTPHGSFYTNKEVKVEELSIITDQVAIPRHDTKFDHTGPISQTDFIKMKYYRINDSFDIIHEHSELAYKALVATVKENCKRYTWDWRGFYWFQERFADIKYNHAITVHKSQGSTYKETVINVGNINFNPKVEERKRLLYTAITRASDLIILNNVK